MRYEFITNKNGIQFLWNFRTLLDAEFCKFNLESHGEYGIVSNITINLVDDYSLGLEVVK